MFLNINYVLVSRHVFFSCFVVYVVCRLHKITLDPLVFILYTSTEYEMWCHKTCDYIFFLQNMYQIETKCGAQKNNRKQYWFWFTKIIFIVNTPMSDQIVVHTHTHARLPNGFSTRKFRISDKDTTPYIFWPSSTTINRWTWRECCKYT